jgi:hypothetical protein
MLSQSWLEVTIFAGIVGFILVLMITIGIIILIKCRCSNPQIKEEGEVLDIIEMQAKAIPEFNQRLESSLYLSTIQESNDRQRMISTLALSPSARNELGMFDFMVSFVKLVFIIIKLIFIMFRAFFAIHYLRAIKIRLALIHIILML